MIYSVFDKEFCAYGRVVQGYDAQCTALQKAMLAHVRLPAEGTAYDMSVPQLEALPEAKALADSLYGGMPVQFGCCYGSNTKLNCLEYHRDSEFNLGDRDFILLLAKQTEMEGETLDTGCVKAFLCPAGTLVEIYATTLHYAPCHTPQQQCFRVMVALPRGTNGPKPNLILEGGDDALLWACNKWLLAHSDSAEARQGAHIGLSGENIDVES
jgi:hypothetical protein